MDRIIPEKQIIAVTSAINNIGPGAVAEKLFRENILPGRDAEASRSILVARFAAAVSPARTVNDWYTVALYSGITDQLMPEAENTAYTELLLQSVGVPYSFTSAIREAVSPLPPGKISPLALAIRFADIHIGDDGEILDLKNGIREIKRKDTEGIERELMNICYELQKRDKYDSWLDALSDLATKGGKYGQQKESVQRTAEAEALCVTS